MYITDRVVRTTDRVNIYNRQSRCLQPKEYYVQLTELMYTTGRVGRTTDKVNVYNRQSKYLQPTE